GAGKSTTIDMLLGLVRAYGWRQRSGRRCSPARGWARCPSRRSARCSATWSGPSVQQLSGLLNMLLAVFGGLWIPIEVMPHLMRTIANYTPVYWAAQVARGPLLHGELNLHAIAVLLAWAAALGAIAFRRFRLDTARA